MKLPKQKKLPPNSMSEHYIQNIQQNDKLFMIDHCTNNNIITTEQTGGKQGSWGCADQLLIHKMILDEAKQHCHNLLMMWFDYKKAFDSVPQEWILKALELAQVPLKIIRTIKSLMGTWPQNFALIQSKLISSNIKLGFFKETAWH